MKTLMYFFLFAVLPIAAQESVSEVRRQVFGNPLDPANQDVINLLNRMNVAQEHSELLFDNWQPMNAEGLDGTYLHVDSANYHISADKIFFVNHGQLYEIFPEKVSRIKLHDHTFVQAKYINEERRALSHFFEVIEEGEYTLLCKYEIRKEVKNEHPMGIAAATEVNYRLVEKYFFLREGARNPEPMPDKKKDFIMIFRKNRPQMVIFAKENSISIREREDLKAAFAYYNKLASES